MPVVPCHRCEQNLSEVVDICDQSCLIFYYLFRLLWVFVNFKGLPVLVFHPITSNLSRIVVKCTIQQIFKDKKYCQKWPSSRPPVCIPRQTYIVGLCKFISNLGSYLKVIQVKKRWQARARDICSAYIPLKNIYPLFSNKKTAGSIVNENSHKICLIISLAINSLLNEYVMSKVLCTCL